jgi:hypothetical protein
VLTNICSGNSDQTEAVVSSGAVPLLINLLWSTDDELAEQVCCWSFFSSVYDWLTDCCLYNNPNHQSPILSSVFGLWETLQLILQNVEMCMSSRGALESVAGWLTELV